MIITKIELENITSHKKTTIDFQGGLNVLIGQNGSGKSTILNMIGYNLFDFIPGSQKSFLRNEHTKQVKYGLVKVGIIGLNDDHFIIERTLGRQSNVIEVKDARTGTVLTGVNNKSSLRTWLKTQISLKEEFDLGKLFKTSIGVPQGTFTEPFLRAPQHRKDFFDPILQVDVYREVWKKLYEIIKYYKDFIHELEVEKSNLTGRLEQKGELDSEKKKLKDEINETQKLLNQIKKNFDSTSEKFEKFAELKKVLEKSENKCKLLELEHQNLVKGIEKLKVEMKEAENADENCKKTEMDYLTYEKLLIHEENLQKLNESLQRRNEERNELRNQLGDVENRITFLTEQIQALDKHKTEIPKLKIINKTFEVIQNEIEAQRATVGSIKILEDYLNEINKIYTDFSISLDEKEAKLKDLPEIEDELINLKTKLGSFIQRLRDKIKNKVNEESKLNQLEAKKGPMEDNIKRYNYLTEELKVRLPQLMKDFDQKQEYMNPILNKLEPIEKMIRELEYVSDESRKVSEDMKKTRENHDIYKSFEKLAKKLITLKKTRSENKKSLKTAKKNLEDEKLNIDQLKSQFDEDDYNKYQKEKNELNDQLIGLKSKITATQNRVTSIDKKLANLSKMEKDLELVQGDIKSVEFMREFTETIRGWFNEAQPKITNALISKINNLASDIYRDLMETENVQLFWEEDYNIKVATPTNEKDFQQLSGGEQMSAALAIRLAILKILTNADFAFFDEPTTNLDKEKRTNLAKAIQNIKGFKQLFVISHDDTFIENAENVIKFTKDENEITHVQYLS